MAGKCCLYFGDWLSRCLFPVPRKKYLDWTETGRDIFFIGRRIAGFASGRFILEILLSVLVVIFTPLNILGFLAGLLSLVVATYGERIIGAIKE